MKPTDNNLAKISEILWKVALNT